MMILEGTTPELQRSMDDLLDFFGGADGGYKFAKFCGFLIEIDSKAKQGDEAAKQILEVVHRMARLVRMM